MKKLTIMALGALLIIGCVQTRTPQPIAIKQAQDSAFKCPQIAIEFKTNTEVAAAKIEKNRAGDVQDILVGFIIWPGLADFQNADGTEGNALLDRNVYLREIAKQKYCKGMKDWPTQPERYE